MVRRIEPATAQDPESSTSGAPAGPSQSSNSGLFRSPAVRDASAKGIRERRSHSRADKERALEDLNVLSVGSNSRSNSTESPKPADLVLATSEGVISHRRNVSKSVARTTHGASPDDHFPSALSADSLGVQSADESSRSTPRPDSAHRLVTPNLTTQTPPFSPGGEPRSPTMSRGESPALPPKALPTPPPQRYSDSMPSYLHAVSSSEERSASHTSHTSNQDSVMPAPLSPRKASTQSSDHLTRSDQSEADFAKEATERHRLFIEKEKRAVSEVEKLQIFAEYLIAESAIRRRRYAQAWERGVFDESTVRDRLFEVPQKPARKQSKLRESSIASPIEPPSPDSATEPPQRPETQWWNNYQPALSPIASMSNGNDEMSSRGRAPSRWWESQTGSGSDGAARKVERSKRESKYMGLPRELREAMQYESARNTPGPGQPGTSPGMESHPRIYGPDEYPEEKVGWHNEQSPIPPPPPLPQQPSPRSATFQDDSSKLDVSRLVTLPPPYPRHHPAVNNNHPDLISYRTLVRAVSDLTEIVATKERYRKHMQSSHEERQRKTAENRKLFRTNLHRQIEEGSISFAEAAEAESALLAEEKDQDKASAQMAFEAFQEMVLKPVHDILSERINKTTYYFDDLRSKVFDEGLQRNPNQTQEEGDEQPELLEKLTQLKWLFEAREQLYREVYDLLTERNEKYKAIVILPYQQSGNHDKVRSTEWFFLNDGQDRLVAFETETLKRHETFMDVIEENVTRGVELQLSAFWDIAPPLLTILQSIPANLAGFGIRIPPDEYEENPSYHDYPLQYLYTLLSHAGKSTYQFIESQTNLLCLLHEAKTGVMLARCKVMEAERVRNGENEESVHKEWVAATGEEEKTLTADLKDKVQMVESQWTEALGSQLADTKRRVRESLRQEGGWDDLEGEP